MTDILYLACFVSVLFGVLAGFAFLRERWRNKMLRLHIMHLMQKKSEFTPDDFLSTKEFMEAQEKIDKDLMSQLMTQETLHCKTPQRPEIN